MRNYVSITGGKILTPMGLVQRDILLHGQYDKEGTNIDATGLYVLPGLIDPHVHFREPGAEGKGTMQTESLSAYSGGMTTVCEMPNTEPPTTNRGALEWKRIRAQNAHCDIRFFFGVRQKEHLEELEKIWSDKSESAMKIRSACVGMKVYMDHSTGNQRIQDNVLRSAFSLCAKLDIIAVCHCEDAEINREMTEKYRASKDVADHSQKRPVESEEKAIRTAMDIARTEGTRLHVAHLSTEGGLECIAGAKREGLPVSCEVAPHHLFLTTEDYPWLQARGKVNPPLRPPKHRDALWNGIVRGMIDCIASDHAPHTIEEKKNTHPHAAPSGMPGTETLLPLLLTVAAGKWPHPYSLRPETANISMKEIERLCFYNANTLFRLTKADCTQEGRGDCLLIDPQKEWTVDGNKLHAKCGWTPYEGWQMRGSVVRVLREKNPTPYTSTTSGMIIGSRSTERSK